MHSEGVRYQSGKWLFSLLYIFAAVDALFSDFNKFYNFCKKYVQRAHVIENDIFNKYVWTLLLKK